MPLHQCQKTIYMYVYVAVCGVEAGVDRALGVTGLQTYFLYIDTLAGL